MRRRLTDLLEEIHYHRTPTPLLHAATEVLDMIRCSRYSNRLDDQIVVEDPSGLTGEVLIFADPDVADKLMVLLDDTFDLKFDFNLFPCTSRIGEGLLRPWTIRGYRAFWAPGIVIRLLNP